MIRAMCTFYALQMVLSVLPESNEAGSLLHVRAADETAPPKGTASTVKSANPKGAGQGKKQKILSYYNPADCGTVSTFVQNAAKHKKKFDEMVDALAKKTGGLRKCAPLKGENRMCEKMTYYASEKTSFMQKYLDEDYVEQQAEPCTYHPKLTDAVRCMIVYRNASELLKGVKEAKNALSAKDAKFVKVQNRIASIGDFLTLVGIYKSKSGLQKKTDTCAEYHVGEVQFHTVQVIAGKEGPYHFKKMKDLAGQFGQYNMDKWAKEAREALDIRANVKAMGDADDGKLGKEMMSFFQSGHHMYEAARSGVVKEADPTLAADLKSKSSRVYKAMLAKAGCNSGKSNDPCEIMKALPAATFGPSSIVYEQY